MEKELDLDIELALCNSETSSQDYDQEDAAPPDLQTTEKSPAPTHSTAYLDGLRGLAALIVYIGHHAAWWYGPGGPIEEGFGYHGHIIFATFPFIRTLYTGGSAAVAIFFVLSGYVLSISPLQMLHDGKRRETYRNLASAFVRRPFRLFIPPAGVSLVFVLIMHLPFGLAPRLSWPEPEPTVFLELLKWCREFAKMVNPLKKHGIAAPWFPYNPPAWTLAAEYKGSIVVFTLLGAFSFTASKYRLYLFALTGAFTLMILEWTVACFMSGVILAITSISPPHVPYFHALSNRTKTAIHTTLFLLAWFTLCQPSGHNDPEFSYATPGYYLVTKATPALYYNDEYWRFWNSLGAALLVCSVLNLTWLQAFFRSRIMLFLGKISFSLYLVHMPLTWTIGDRICRLLGVKRGDFETWFDGQLAIPDVGPTGVSTGFLVSQMVIFPLSVGVAVWTAKYLDRPGIKAGRWVARRLRLEMERGGRTG